MFKNKKIYIIPVLGFITLILSVSILLKLPMSSVSGIKTLDAVFTATSAVTGTGLTTISVANEFSLIGKIIILIAIQVGGIGFMIFFSFLFTLRNKKIRLSNTIILSNEINPSSESKVKDKTIKLLKYVFGIEFLGALLLAIFFVPHYGIVKGIWFGIFHSVSAFCNAGIDIMGDSSLIAFTHDLPVNIVFMFLMFLGSIGFFATEDFSEYIKGNRKNLQLLTKIILVTSITLIIGGTIFFKLLTPGISLLQSLFLSVTSRSTGFSTFNIAILNRPSKLFLILLMFIGGAAGSTAAGIRVTNFAILILLPLATLKSEELVVGFRKIDSNTIKKSITIVVTYIVLIAFSFMLLLVLERTDAIDLLFELVSAFTTTGLTTFDTNSLSVISKIIIIFYMYMGRLGPITLLTLFTIKSKRKSSIDYPSADLML